MCLSVCGNQPTEHHVKHHPLSLICTKGHVGASNHTDQYGTWCDKCGGSVGYYANVKALMVKLYSRGTIHNLPEVFK